LKSEWISVGSYRRLAEAKSEMFCYLFDYTSSLLPATFELVGQDSHGSAVIKYGFKLKQWFVTRGEYNYYGYFNSLSWCRSIGYQMPRVRDFTNSQCIGVMGGSGCEGSVGTTPSSSSNHYQRNINAGFLTE
jgi:hypothetical protein